MTLRLLAGTAALLALVYAIPLGLQPLRILTKYESDFGATHQGRTSVVEKRQALGEGQTAE
jgi:hypothetical protein